MEYKLVNNLSERGRGGAGVCMFHYHIAISSVDIEQKCIKIYLNLNFKQNIIHCFKNNSIKNNQTHYAINAFKKMLMVPCTLFIT